MLRKFVKFIEPPASWKPAVIILLGLLTGIMLLIFHASEAQSYISDKPETCINCHVMYPQYTSWVKSSHREAATCADCHVPQDNLISKYYVKGTDGLRHAAIFTMRTEPQVITIAARGTSVVQNNCIRCHQDLVEMSSLVTLSGKSRDKEERSRCWDCHRDVPHGSVRSLSSAPGSLVPRLPSIMPDWINNLFDKN